MKKSFHNCLWLTSLALTGLLGCAGEQKEEQTGTPDAKFVVQTEPAGAVGVGQAREAAKDDEEVVITGRIGGSRKPFNSGLAAFTIVDEKVPWCGRENDENCPTPWDYCCTQNEVKKNNALIKLVDSSGKTVSGDAKELLGVKELSLVVIKGKTQRDDEGNLVVLASQVYVKE